MLNLGLDPYSPLLLGTYPMDCALTMISLIRIGSTFTLGENEAIASPSTRSPLASQVKRSLSPPQRKNSNVGLQEFHARLSAGLGRTRTTLASTTNTRRTSHRSAMRRPQ